MSTGVRELVLVGQDVSSWGRDLPGRASLADLVRRLSAVDGLRWLRLMYIQPDGITPDLLDAMAESPVVCRYLDMPLQHASRDVLRRMGRRGDGAEFLRLIGVDPRADARCRPADHPHRRFPGRDPRGQRGAAPLRPEGPPRRTRRVRVLAGGGHAGRSDARPGPAPHAARARAAGPGRRRRDRRRRRPPSAWDDGWTSSWRASTTRARRSADTSARRRTWRVSWSSTATSSRDASSTPRWSIPSATILSAEVR